MSHVPDSNDERKRNRTFTGMKLDFHLAMCADAKVDDGPCRMSYVMLQSVNQDSGEAWITQAEIAKRTRRTSVSTVKRYLANLVETGWWETRQSVYRSTKTKGGRESNAYAPNWERARLQSTWLNLNPQSDTEVKVQTEGGYGSPVEPSNTPSSTPSNLNLDIDSFGQVFGLVRTEHHDDYKNHLLAKHERQKAEERKENAREAQRIEERERRRNLHLKGGPGDTERGGPSHGKTERP
jgi:Helix-turn-helix domain